MALAPGTRLGPFEILSLLDVGGMGEVYRARDVNLQRDVALKVLPDLFARDPARLARFQREAQVLAALNHSNIAAIYGLEESGGIRTLVMELVEGPTLHDLIAGRALGATEALRIAKQLADALEAAHQKGIVHRDLKPANIKLRPDGVVKVLDFGLAKLLAPADRGDDQSEAGSHDRYAATTPTITDMSTRLGVILGTPAYMSPEQARGKEVDKRTDIWAFGCVLYEMLTGKRTFPAVEATISDELAAILKTEPDWKALPAQTPMAIRRLLRRTLEKDARVRLHDMADVRIEIDEALSGTEPLAPVAVVASRRRERLAWASSLAVVALAGIVMAMWAFAPAPPAPERRVEITTPPTSDPASLAISPDGHKLIFVATFEGRPRLWLRSLDAVSSRSLPGTDSATYPFWSPDNRSVGFFADGKLKRIELDGGSVQTLANAPQSRGGAWNPDGTILFAPNGAGPLFRVSATGGEPTAVTKLAPQQTNHRFPQFLPDGRHFLCYVVSSRPDVRGIYVGQLDGSEARRLLDADTAAVYTSSGHLLFVQQGTLYAQAFDPASLALRENPFSVAEQVTVDGASTSYAAASASVSGPIVYRTGPGNGQRQFVWFDRSGKEIVKLGDPDRANALSPDLSFESRRVVLARTSTGNQNLDIWQLDTTRGVLTRVTSDPAIDNFPLWSPDGSRIVFSSSRNGVVDLFWKLSSGAGGEDPLLSTTQSKAAMDWSRDGRFLLYLGIDGKTGSDLWVLPMEGERKPFPVVQTAFEESNGQFSPDGKWIAYQSNESSRFEIYVQPFPGSGNRSTISTNGGAQVRWRHDGKELFYIALDGRLMAVLVRPASNGQVLEPDTAVPLFQTRVGGAVPSLFRPMYMVSADGRFLMNTVVEEAASPITLILDWKGQR